MKTKTLLMQGKAVDYTRDLLLETIQAVKNQNSAESPDKTNSIHLTDERTTGGVHQQVGLMSPSVSANARNDHLLAIVGDDFEAATGVNESDSESESSEHPQLALNSSEVLIKNLGEKFSNEIAKTWSEISIIKSSLTNTDTLRPLQQELDELRLRCTTYESTIDHLEKEKASFLEVIKILSSDDNSNHSTDTSDGNKISDCATGENGLRLAARRKRKRNLKLSTQKHVTKILPTPAHENL